MHKGTASPLIPSAGPPGGRPEQPGGDPTPALDLPTVLAAPFSSRSYDCDCACALDVPQGLVLQPATALLSPPDNIPFSLGEGWQAHFNPEGPVGVIVLNAEAERVLAAFDTPIPPQEAPVTVSGLSPTVVREGVRSLTQVGMLRPPAMPFRRPAQPSTLSAWLHVTEACNLDCPYCYVHKSPSSMSVEVGRRAIDRLAEMASRHGYSSLKLKYAGGEPTLEFSLVGAMHAYAARRTADAGLALEESLLTNGVGVTDAMLNLVARAGIKLMVSLDGDPATHDRMRARRDGWSTHASVTGTVERALAFGVRPSISITLTALNLDGVSAAVEFALERDLPFNLNFYRECIGADVAGPSLLMPNENRLVETILGIFDLIKDHPSYSRPLTSILDRTRLDLPHSSPCSAGRDYLVVDTVGRVSACQMLMEEPWTDLADEDPLSTIRKTGERIFNAVEEQPDCHACPWRTACAGGCPLMRGTVLHDRYCQVYQVLFPELIRLEAGRLLAAHSALSTHAL